MPRLSLTMLAGICSVGAHRAAAAGAAGDAVGVLRSGAGERIPRHGALVAPADAPRAGHVGRIPCGGRLHSRAVPEPPPPPAAAAADPPPSLPQVCALAGAATATAGRRCGWGRTRCWGPAASRCLSAECALRIARRRRRGRACPPSRFPARGGASSWTPRVAPSTTSACTTGSRRTPGCKECLSEWGLCSSRGGRRAG